MTLLTNKELTSIQNELEDKISKTLFKIRYDTSPAEILVKLDRIYSVDEFNEIKIFLKDRFNVVALKLNQSLYPKNYTEISIIPQGY